MSLSIAYESVEDAQMRLEGTVVLYDRKPVYITSVRNVGEDDPKGDIFRVYAQPLPFVGHGDQEQFRKFISSKKFDLAPFPMGFMNFEKNAFYCSRLPRRQQRQGLTGGTFECSSLRQGMGAYDLAFAMAQQGFVDMVAGDYPDFRRSIELMIDASSVAFSRCFALMKDSDIPELLYLYHKKEKVGFLMNGDLTLSKKGECLKESLREVGVPC